MNLRIHRRALEEIDHEVDYYETRQPGLGGELEDEIDAVLTVILQLPEAAPPRKIVGWRCSIGFRSRFHTKSLAAPSVVLALAHMSRRPGYWAKRRG